MKKQLILITLLLLGLSLSMFAQGRRVGKLNNSTKEAKTAEERATNLTARMEKQLGLSAEQKEQIYAFNLDAAKKVDVLRTDAKENRELESFDKQTHREKRKAIEQERDSKISGILDAEQKVKYDNMKRNARQRLKQRKFKGNKGKMQSESEDLDED